MIVVVVVVHSGTLSQTPDLENFASAYPSSNVCQLSSGKVTTRSIINWTVVGQLSHKSQQFFRHLFEISGIKVEKFKKYF